MSWCDQFQAIAESIAVSEGVNDYAIDRYGDGPCGCVPNFEGDRICFDSRCINFATQTECVRCRPGCCNQRIQNKLYAKLDVLHTPGKGHGLFAAEDLAKHQFVREYVGELISPQEFSRRNNERARLMEHQFILQLKNGTYLDAGRKGSISRFINHSCEPNCFVEVWTVHNHLRVGIFTLKAIPSGTELTFDYQWRPSSRPPTKCHCGTPSCRGYIEVFSREELEDMKVRKGLWRSGGVLRAANATDDSVFAIYTPEGLLQPSQLIGRRVKVWWEGNLAYLEADVESYNAKTNKYLCR